MADPDIGLDQEAIVQSAVMLDHFNANHADTMLFIARFGAGRPDAVDAEAIGVDAEGVEFAVRGDGHQVEVARLPFVQRTTDFESLRTELLAGLERARAAAGDEVPLTSLEREFRDNPGLPTHHATVAATAWVTPNMREVVIEGTGLTDFASVGGDQFVYVFVPRPGGVLPDDYSMADHRGADPATAPIGAYYTVRSWDAAGHRLTLWMVVHGESGGVGEWAAHCEPGDPCAIWGPREGMRISPGASSWLLACDESGLAAVAALLDELPSTAPVRVIAETVDVDHVAPLPEREHLTVTWLFRDGDEAGAGTRLLDEIRSAELATPGLVVFGAAETKQATAIRRHVRHEVGLPATNVYVTGYWRRDAR